MHDMQSQIDEIMDNFDFARCMQAMAFLDWKWQGQQVTEPMLREAARKYLREVAEKNDIIAYGSGGLHAKNNDGFLSLTFELSHWECEAVE